jgi:hypothetical protein
LIVSEQNAEQTSGEPGSLSVGLAILHSFEAHDEPVVASVPEPAQEPAMTPTEIESPGLAPEQGTATELPEAVAPEVHVGTAHPANSEAADPETVETHAPRTRGKVTIMSAGDHDWTDHSAGSKSETGGSKGLFGKRRIAALAAVLALATAAGALGGALATAALMQVAADDKAIGGDHAFEATVARIDADILALKAGAEHTSKLGMSQFNKTSERLDRVEKAQAEPAAKLAKLSEAVDKLRATPLATAAPAAAATATAKDVTGSVSPSAAAATPAKVEVGRLPLVEGWVLRDVAHGGALIEGRRGVYEVYAGDDVPGLGRIDAIRRQDGRWVVVTSKGLIAVR